VIHVPMTRIRVAVAPLMWWASGALSCDDCAKHLATMATSRELFPVPTEAPHD
jgi:hypothetical protein